MTAVHDRAAHGARDLAIGQGTRLLCQVIGLVVLSRLLTPAQFGVVAIATAIVGVGEVLRDFGLSAAAIRMPTLSPRQRDVLFAASAAVGIVLAVVFFGLADALAAIFRDPELKPVIQAMSALMLINGLTAQYRAELTRTLRFRTLAVADTAAAVVGLGTAIGLAFAGFGYWALVSQVLVTAVVAGAIVVSSGRWLPRFPRRGHGSRALLRFGGHVAVAQLLSFAGTNVDTLVLGLAGNPNQVGIYNRAFQLVMTPLVQLRAPAQTVSIPTLSHVRDDKEAYGRYILVAQAALGYTTAPFVALLAGAAAPIVSVILGAEWSESVPIVAILSFAGGLQLLASVANWVFTVSALGRSLQIYSLASLGVKTLAVVALAAWGAIGVAVGYSLAVLLLWPWAIYLALSGAGVRLAPVYWQSARIFVLGIVAGGAAYACVQLAAALPALLQIAAGGLAVTMVFALGALFPSVRSDIRLAMKLLRRALRRNAT